MNELPTTATGVLRILPVTKEEIARFSKQVIQQVQAGEVNPMEILVLIRAFQAAGKTILDCIKTNLQAEGDKYSEKTLEVFGARVEKADVGVSYAYEHSCDREWERLRTDMETAMERLKEREEFLRTLKTPLDIYDKETGETWTIHPPLRKGSEGFKVYIK
jgi:hypothetical protein